MTRFTVLLEVVWRGAVGGSTHDDVDAETPEELAIAAWRALRPEFSFAPLLTAAAQPFRA